MSPFMSCSPSPLCLLSSPAPPQLLFFCSCHQLFSSLSSACPTNSSCLSLLLHFPLALPPSLMGNNIYQSPALLVATATDLITPSTPPTTSSFFLSSSTYVSISPCVPLCVFALFPSFHLSILQRLFLNCKWAGWLAAEQRGEPLLKQRR